MIETELLIRATCMLLGLWGVLHSFQWLVNLPNWRAGTALGWDLQSLRQSSLLRSPFAVRLFDEAGLRVIAVMLLFLSAALPVAPIMTAGIVLLALFFVAVLILGQRAFADGGDKIVMATASGTTLQIVGLVVHSDRMVLAGALWTGGQLILSYFASGASKLMLANWRNGTVPKQALTSYAWGQSWTAAPVGKSGVALALAWAIMAAEILFPLALLLPAPWLYAALAAMFLLHLVIAAAMGLNSYPWAFLTAYPSVILLSQRLAL